MPKLVINIVAPLAVAFAISLASGAAVSWLLVSNAYERQIKAQINADFALLQQRVQRLKIVAVIDAIDFRLHRNEPINASGVYSLRDAQGTLITGNLNEWPVGKAGSDNWLRFSGTVDSKGARIIARTDDIDGYYQLLVGRRLEPALAFQQSAATALVLTGLITFVILVAITGISGSLLNRRFAAIGKAIESVKEGDRNARAPITGNDEIAHLSDKVNDMLATLDRQIYHLRNISRVIAHEFRTPLSRQRKALAAELERNSSENITVSLEQAEGLLDLSNSLLEIAEHESGFERKTARQDLAQILQDQERLFCDVVEQKGIRLKMETTPAHVLGDKWLLMRLTANLIENAIEASTAGDTVFCRSYKKRTLGIIEVADQGGGLSHHTIDLLIEAAASSGGMDHSSEKHGIGLRMVRAIALRHGAKIRYKNSQEGTVAYVDFPLAE